MVKSPKAKSAPSKTLDPTRATIYVAVLATVSAIIVAAISNLDKFRTVSPPTQAEEIIAFQEHRYNQISQVLDERANLVQELEMEPSVPKKKRRSAKAKSYIKANRDTKVSLAEKQAAFNDAIKNGDHFKATVIKTEMNTLLGKEQERYLIGFGNQQKFRAAMLMPMPMLRVPSKPSPLISDPMPVLRDFQEVPRSKSLALGSTAAPESRLSVANWLHVSACAARR